MKKLIYLFVMAMLVSGCVTVESVNRGGCTWDSWGGYMVCNNYEVEFISDPPGAKIEIENNYIGVTPIVQRWHGNYAANSQWIVKAYPSQPGQFVQTKVLSMNQLPRKVYFDMNLHPMTPSLDVNINK